MSRRLGSLVANYSKPIILLSLVVVGALGAGATQVEQASSLSQFESDSEATRALDYVETNFTAGDANTTTVQVIVRNDDGNVLSRDSLLRSLRFQQALRDDESINATLATDRPVVGVANVVATTAIRVEQFRNLQDDAERLRERNATLQDRRGALQRDRESLRERQRELNATVVVLRDALNETRTLQAELVRLNASLRAGEISQSTYDRRVTAIQNDLAAARADAVRPLNESETASFDRAWRRTRDLQTNLTRLRLAREAGDIDQQTFEERAARVESEFERVYRLGTRGVLADRFSALEAEASVLQERGEELQAAFEDLQADFRDLRERRQALANASRPTLDEQVAQLESMNDSAVEDVVATVLAGEDGGDGPTPPGGDDGPSRDLVFQLLPTGYEQGSTTATARTMIVVQQTESDGPVQGPGGPAESITDAQLELSDVAQATGGTDDEYVVFGFGIISDEISRSQTDSFLLVGPLALLFVLVALLVAYRDLLDIVLGFVGIFAVLAVTFGFMGWFGIAFNQILIAVPVLLIGLSIDYAIHIFMRHREQRTADDVSPRRAMRTALAGVGVALLWVTATTVIGFASNLISPLGPIRDFGVVSSVGIVAAMGIFGLFVPALKVELDGLLEGFGLDRRKRAFGTGGGPLSSLLSVGAAAARRAPLAVIVLAVLVTAVAGAAGSQVSTSFEQSDFIAEDPPEWMDSLPEPFRPSEYSAKSNLAYVNENFRREDAQSQVLLRADGGALATPAGMERLAAAERRAADSPVTFVLSNDEPSLTAPLREMRAVAANNETFNATFEAADTDGDGVPDRNVEGVLDGFFAAAPDRAANVVQRVDGEYVAARIVVSVKGTAGTAAVTEETRAMAAAATGDGVEATATGSQVVNQIVQNDLFDTVVESLAVSLVAVFLFLMIAYRVTEGSASLGAVTLLPVGFSVAWIVGTMFALGQPFNVLTGTITSLTVGLGVAYSIHLSERYTLELERQGDVHAAMETTVTGTGGALLGSAATTVGGFGTLVIAIFPALQQFGLITGLTIVYAFLASVLVLPSLLVVWTRYAGPDVADGSGPETRPTANVADQTGADATGAADGSETDDGVPGPGEDRGNGYGSDETDEDADDDQTFDGAGDGRRGADDG